MNSHRKHVGGLWYQVGSLQFRWLVNQGVRPNHYVLDIGCGSLRAGVHLVPYLDAGHYMGVDQSADLIERGLSCELGPVLEAIKRPFFHISGEFDFTALPQQPDFAIAQSLFTHLPPEAISKCFERLGTVSKQTTTFFATYYDRDSHGHKEFAYSVGEMVEFGEVHGWKATYIGDWGHPRGQVMVRYRPTTCVTPHRPVARSNEFPR